MMKREVHANELEISGGILYYARCFNSEMAKNKYSGIPKSLDYWSKRVGWLIHRKQWHTVSGKKVKLPLEVQMVGTMLLTRAWMADIFSRKARDRKAVSMRDTLYDFLAAGDLLVLDIMQEVSSHRADKAFKAYVWDLVKYRHIHELQRLGFLPFLPWPKRMWYQLFGIPEGVVFKRPKTKGSKL